MSEANDNNNKVIVGSDNVFADIGVELDTRATLKVAIAVQISRVILDRGLTQQEASKILNTKQADISNITRGKLDGFSVERLMEYLMGIGCNIDIHLSPNRDGQGHAKVHAPFYAHG